jgi:hypothetical protein
VERSRSIAVRFDEVAAEVFRMADGHDHFATWLGCAAMDVWGDMPRDIQEALFETAMMGRDTEREELARLLHNRHPRTLHPPKPA